MDPEYRPGSQITSRRLAVILRQIDRRSRSETEDLLAQLMWFVWPTVWSQDQ
jgi:hypothetical protein